MIRVKAPFFNTQKQIRPTQPPTSTTNSFNAIINRLSSKGAHHDVLITYSSMLESNVAPDSYTFPSLLKACTFSNFFHPGLLFHQAIVVNGYSSDAYIASSLINFYAEFGHLHIARKVFDIMPERNVVPWTSIIGCYSRYGDHDMAFSMFNEMRYQGIEPTSVTLLSMLSQVSELIYAQCLHNCAILCGFLSDMALCNSLLNVYGNCGSIEDSKRLFECMDKKDQISWNSLILGYAQRGNLDAVMELLKVMQAECIKPDRQILGSVASVASMRDDLKLGRSVHGQILRAGFEYDTHLETSLIVMYTKGRNMDYAFRIFERNPEKDVVMWTAMISGLGQSDSAAKALSVFSQMLKSTVEPSTATMASVLAACAQLGSFHLGASVHGYILRQGFSLDIPAKNSLITMYAKCCHLDQSFAVFKKMNRRDLVSWNAIVVGYAQNGHICKAFSIFNEMRMSLQSPDSITIVSLLQGCSSLGALHQGKWMHCFIIRNTLRPCILVDTALVDMYCKCGDLDAAWKCFNKMERQDLISWGAIIAGYGCHGKGETALRLYSEFLQTGMKPNHVIFLSVLSSCSHNGLVSQGLNIFQSMSAEYGITPNIEHNACVVDLLSRAGRVKEAYSFYKRLFPEPVLDVLGILLHACRANADNELSGTIAREILMLKPRNPGNYVQLAHCYASMNKWEGVGEAWTQMRSLGLKKLPGWSFIEAHGKIATFFTDHNSHPQLEEVALILKTLRAVMCKKREMDIDIKTSEVLDIS